MKHVDAYVISLYHILKAKLHLYTITNQTEKSICRIPDLVTFHFWENIFNYSYLFFRVPQI